MKNPLLLICLVPACLFSGEIIQGALTIENSIISKMEMNVLKTECYSDNQLREIQEGLSHKEEMIRLVSYNMLFDAYDHNLDACNRWTARLPRIVELLKEMHPDVIGMQELLPHQIESILNLIGNEFDFFANRTLQGECNGIFYRKERFECLEGKFWDTAEEPFTMVHLKDRKTNKEFALFNTHLSFSKVNRRERQAQEIVDIIEQYESDLPVLLTGDMNTFPNRPDLPKLPFLDGDYIHRIFTKKFLKDTREISLLGHLGPISTFTNLSLDVVPFTGTGTPGIFLDHIYANDKISVLIHAVQPARVDGHFPSDHMPVLIDFFIP